ncbi:unnamed protein product [Adineta steineri]|uniref:G-protein coupled receptors family 1 profile domain-containing protein n=1 Tax=Adineta steineri TaxID=433720 RepID=A0A819HE51_9BILA|nr:unnamed protein product [Adineta steineri]CAF3899452.1 unnamed protein product [Adineta steineri]
MSSSASDADLIAVLNYTSTQINRYFAIFIFLFGVIGNGCNILVLSQKPLRSNPCMWFFLSSSIAFFISFIAGIPSRFLSTWGADLTNINQFLCKFRIFIALSSMTIAFWLIMLATVDRWLSSSMNNNRRRMSSLKNAQRSAIVIVILSSVLHVQELFCFEANLINTPVKCYSKTVICGIISDLCFAVITIICPLLLMFIFGLMILSNLRHSRARIQPVPMAIDGPAARNASTVITEPHYQQRKMNRHLLIMLSIQVLILLVFTLPFAIAKIYTTITRDTPKSALQRALENFIFTLFFLFVFIAAGMPFYINTLAGGHVFRQALLKLMNAFIRKIMCHCN